MVRVEEQAVAHGCGEGHVSGSAYSSAQLISAPASVRDGKMCVMTHYASKGLTFDAAVTCCARDPRQ